MVDNQISTNDLKPIYESSRTQLVNFIQQIWTYTGFAITINVAIWSYFITRYVDSLARHNEPLFIATAAAISSITIAIWRYHNRDVDNHIVGLYADLLRYEFRIGIPSYSGTVGFLRRFIPSTGEVFSDARLSDEEKLEVISRLVDCKHMLWRNHILFEWGIFAVVVLMFIVVFILGLVHLCSNEIRSSVGVYIALYSLSLTGIIVAAVIICHVINVNNKEPKTEYVRRIIASVIAGRENNL